MNKTGFFVFDVESVGLYGEGFAFGFVFIDRLGSTVFEGYDACDPDRAEGDDGGRDWIAEHVIPFSPAPTCADPATLRGLFAASWIAARHFAESEGFTVYMAADVPWPVEARFLLDTARQFEEMTTFEAPYPLIDIASVLLTLGFGPLEAHSREQGEEPAHNALNDARQSARLLKEGLITRSLKREPAP